MFLKQKLHVSRDRIRDSLQKRGGPNRDWFSLTLKLDDFTSGFQTNCADMAGAREEVI
jgi:hypothetical protein